jgi:serine/threonine-protein kinase
MPDLDLHELPDLGDPDDHDASGGDGTRRFRAVWRTLGLDQRRSQSHLTTDGRRARRPRGGTSIPPPPGQLPLITVGPSAGDAELVLKTEIGDGGAGVVFAASQRSLGREVAVKRLVPEATGEEARAALVQEARVTGSLEHPNVVPVHALGADAHGRPVMVMRRIHGTPWGTLLRAKRGPEWAPAGDAVVAHLEVLLQVCNAVWFAHSRGIIHGDLKPDNVMLGGFGEVYVLDWGAAMSTQQNDPRGLPWAGDVQTVHGTPAYMAPEMVGMGSAISERTDVYLLGATLHEILTGAPPHAGGALFDVMKSAFVSRPFAYPAAVPRELAAICHRAMAADPAARYAGAGELRRAILEHLEHRASIVLDREAAARAETLFAAIAGDAPDRRQTAHELYAECRFGFQQALRAWGGNDDARAGLVRATVAMVELELAAGAPRAAALLAAELTGPHVELRARVEALSRRVEAEGAELARLRVLERDLDADAQAGPRRAFVAVVAALGAVMLLVSSLLQGTTGRLAYAIVNPLIWVIVAGAAAWIGRRRVFPTRAGRIIVGGALVGGVAVFVNRFLAMVMRDGALADAVVADLQTLAAVAAMIALAADRRFAAASACFLVAAVLAVVFPAHAVQLLALALLLFALGSALGRRRPTGDAPLVK